MFCKNCGKEIHEGDSFCRECGTKVDGTTTSTVSNTQTTYTGTQQPKKGQAIASLVIGICSFIFGWLFIPLPIIGIIVGATCKTKCSEKTVGIVLNSIALGIIVIVYLLIGTAVMSLIGLVEENCPDGSCIEQVIEDEQTGEILESLRPWNLYKHLRTGEISHTNTLEGGWRYLGSAKEYYTFKDGEFYWYKDVDVRDDNYWYGTYTITTGKAGLASVGLDESKVDSIIAQSNGTISENDIYSMIMTPTKIFADGVDKSSTNIKEGQQWKAVWILVDHGVDGIEAQVLHLDDNETAYYVKLED